MGGFLAGFKPAKNQAVQHSAFAPASALVAALLACVGRLRRASHPCRRQGRARKRTFKSESLRKQTLEMPQCGMIHPCRRQGRARKRTFKSESLRKQTLEGAVPKVWGSPDPSLPLRRYKIFFLTVRLLTWYVT